MKKKFISLILFIVSVVALGSLSVSAAGLTGFASGSGTATSPYIINTATQLNYFATKLSEGYTFSGEYVKLNANLNMTSYTWNVSDSTVFEGTFLGNNYTITINASFLGDIGETGMVDWLNLKATQTLTSTLLCDTNKGTIQNCSVKGDVTNNPGNAGLLCKYNYGKIYNSYGFGSLSGEGDDSNCYVGWVLWNYGEIKNCYTILTLSGSAPGKYNELYTDGIAASGSAVYTNCFTGDEVIANSQAFVDTLNQASPVSGYTWSVDSSNTNNGYPIIKQCLDAKTELSYSSDVMFAFHTSSISTTITSTVSGCTIYYTLDGTNPTTSSTRKRYSSSLTFSDDFEIRTTAYKNGQYSVPNVQYGIKLYGSGTASSPYQIKSNLGLYAVRFQPDKVYSLEADLDFTDDEYIHEGAAAGEWKPIEDFTGTFDGECHSITGIAGTYGGLFTSNSGTIKNLRLLDHRLCNRHGDYFGAVANRNSGTITRCYASGGATSHCTYGELGGIAGGNYNGTVSYCQTTGILDTTATVSYSHMTMGGIVGKGGTVEKCVSDIEISAPRSSHDMGSSLRGMGGYYSTDCRYDGKIKAGTYDIYYGIGSADFSGTNKTTRCYDGGFVLTYSGSINPHLFAGTDCYEYTDTYKDYLESSFPAFDFNSVWMISEDGPVPQGVMNADGTYYAKKSYTAPTCNADGKTVYADQNGNTTTKTLAKYPHSLSEGICINSGCTYKEVYKIDLLYNGEAVATDFEMDKNREYQITAAITPSGALDKTLTWTSSDTSVVTVSESGLVTAVGEGSASVTAKASNNVTATMTVKVTETPYLNKIKVFDANAVVGDSDITIPVVFATDKDVNSMRFVLKYPESLLFQSVNAVDFATVEKESENTESGYTTLVLKCVYSEVENVIKYHTTKPFEIIFNVSQAAVPGEVKLEVAEDTLLTGSEEYQFEEALAGSVVIAPKLTEEIEIVGEASITTTAQYTAIVKPDFTTNKEVEWSVDNQEIATVDSFGILNPVTSGTITLTAKAMDGSNVVATKVIEIAKDETATAWKLSVDGVLTISGNGAMADYAAASDTPWAAYAGDITKVVIEEGVTTVGARAFYGLSNVTEVQLGSTITAINTNAFRNCTGLTEITIPAAVTEIGTYAFSGCTALATVNMSDKVETFGNFAFYNCKALSDVYYDGTQESWDEITVGNFNTGLTNATIHVKDAASVTIDGVSESYATVTDAIDAANAANKAVEVKLLLDLEAVEAVCDYVHTIDLNGFTVEELSVEGDIKLVNGSVTVLNVAGIVVAENVTVKSNDAISYGTEGTKSVYAPYGIGANVVEGAQVRIGKGLVDGKIDSESGLRFIGQADMNDTIAGVIITDYYAEGVYTDGYGAGIEIGAQDSENKAYIEATKWQDDANSVFSAAVTGLNANNFNRNYTARCYVEYDGVKIFEEGSTTRSMYTVASGLLINNKAATEDLLKVLNAYVNQTGVRLTLTKSNELSARMSGEGAYTGEAFFTVGETVYEEGMYMVTLEAIGQARIDVDLFNTYVRINNNNSLVSPVTFIMEEEDGVYTIVFDYSSL